jgi:UDP-glucose 4-epimerase
MTVAWVLGSRGLLGAALCRALQRDGTALFSPVEAFRWENGPQLAAQMAAAVQAFAAQVAPADRWEIYWAAGVGTMSSPADDLAPETQALSWLLHCLAGQPRLMAAAGSLAFASSAGAIYAGSAEEIITENTTPMPTTAYARAKLGQEELIRAFAQANRRVTALIARISTLYGPGQSAGKKQGLLAHIARNMLRNQPIQIYVPYDTIRDYLATDDAATTLVSALRTSRESAPGALTRIIASEQPVTIAEIISIFKRLARRTPRIVTSASRLSALYARRVQFRSIALPTFPRTPTQSLVVGIAELMQAERAAFVRAGERNGFDARANHV